MTLYLWPGEKQAFDGLPEELKRGWNVEEETLDAFERPEELRMRYQIAKFDDPSLRKLVHAAREAKTPEEFEGIAAAFDFSALPRERVAEIFFTLGTKLMGKMILHALLNVGSDEDLEGIAALAHVRHLLLEANAPVA